MFFCQSARLVSSTGDGRGDAGVGDDNVDAAIGERGLVEARDNAGLVGHVQRDADRAVAAESFARSPAMRSSSASLVDVGQHHAGAFAHQSRRRRSADAAGTAGDIGDAAGQRFRLRHALQLGLFEQPIFDVEGFLLRQADIGADAGGAAHDVDGVDVEFDGDARRRLVLGEGEHADCRAPDRSPHWGRASPANSARLQRW